MGKYPRYKGSHRPQGVMRVMRITRTTVTTRGECKVKEQSGP